MTGKWKNSIGYIRHLKSILNSFFFLVNRFSWALGEDQKGLGLILICLGLY